MQFVVVVVQLRCPGKYIKFCRSAGRLLNRSVGLDAHGMQLSMPEQLQINGQHNQIHRVIHMDLNQFGRSSWNSNVFIWIYVNIG